MNKKEERLNRLKEILQTQGYVSIRDLSLMLGVSEMTIRRDLKLLEANYRTRDGQSADLSGAIIRNNQEYSILQELRRQSSQKEDIGRFASTLVQREDILIVDSGTTTEYLVRHLPTDLELTVLCYNLNILMEICHNSGVKMLFAGGHYHSDTQMFESEEGLQFISGQRAYKVFLSAAGVHPDMGITCVNSYEVASKRAALRSSLEKILLADSSKFGVVRPAYVCDLSDIDTVITDKGLSDEWRQRILSLGIKLHVV